MKKITFISIFILSLTSVYAQDTDTEADAEGETKDLFNRWVVEGAIGNSKGVKPYAVGYYSSSPNALFGKIQANSYSLGVRYMLSPIVGIKLGFGYDVLTNNSDNGSKPFKLEQLSGNVQAYINTARLLQVQSVLGRFNVLIHGGLQVESMTSRTEQPLKSDGTIDNTIRFNSGRTEHNGGLIIGITPEFRVLKKLALTLDISNVNNYRQHFNWDGSYSDDSNNLSGQQITTSLGLSYSFGESELHSDWGEVRDAKLIEIDEMDKRISNMETMMNDTDKDGVPDYLDLENNSITGVAVDTKGRMIDLNKNGIPDELEKSPYQVIGDMSNSAGNNSVLNGNNGAGNNGAGNNSNAALLKKMINDGYICVYFDSDKTDPTNASTEGIDFILTYLRNNPNATVDINGHADVIGASEYNVKLSENRSKVVKDILEKAGIKSSRLIIKPKGVDNSVDASSPLARRLVRRVTFNINN